MRIVIATTLVPFVRGGAEMQCDDLRAALVTAGHEVEVAAIPFQWTPPERILDHMLACRLLDLTAAGGAPIDLLIALKFPAYLIEHPRKVVWLFHEHRTAYALWDHPLGDLEKTPEGKQVRDAIRRADAQSLPRARGVFTISQNVTRRLREHLELESTPLYQPPRDADKFFTAPAEDYFFFPSRLCRYKRQHLVIEALTHTDTACRVKFCGVADESSYENELRELAASLRVSDRLEWLGSVTEQRKRELYARSLAVIFPPVDEDYGLVTLEAMLAGKPVITCEDSGGPLEFVEGGETGCIVEPEPAVLAAAMDELWNDRARAARLGETAREHYRALDLSWDRIVTTLCGVR